MTELIFRYVGSEADVGASIRAALPDARTAFLLNQYGIIRLDEDDIETFRSLHFLVYIEASQALYYSSDLRIFASDTPNTGDAYYNLSEACFPAGAERTAQNGRGVLLCVIDSGIDYRHPEFTDADGHTRILAYWDQSASGSPVSDLANRYLSGTVYTEDEINKALAGGSIDGSRLVPAADNSGHGTAVASVCGGTNIGAAPGASFLIVKLGTPPAGGFPRTSELMQGIDFCVRESIRLGMPAVINLSFGNSYGSHLGTSLLETYIDSLDGVGKTVLVTGTGNEGAAGGHKAVRLNASVGTRSIPSNDSTETVLLSVAESTPSLDVQIWKSYADVVGIRLTAPTGEVFSFKEGTSGSYHAYANDTPDTFSAYADNTPDTFSAYEDDMPGFENFTGIAGSSRFETRIGYVYHLPSWYQSAQELYLSLEPEGSSWYILPGTWRISFSPVRVTDGVIHLWLPGESARGSRTAFSNPSPFGTFTIPSTASKIISVGAYRAEGDSYADFSGRGFEEYLPRTCKPDLAAPGVDILCAAPGGGYLTQSGTSLAAPFVSGACALLMQWGILQGHDAYLYGEKIKAYLKRGAKTLPAFREYPNPYVGYGKLCVKGSIPPAASHNFP